MDAARDESFMREAIGEAALAASLGEVPVGALVVHDDRVVGRGHNLRERAQDLRRRMRRSTASLQQFVARPFFSGSHTRKLARRSVGGKQ